MVSISSISKLDYKLDYLVIRSKDSVKRVHLSEISVLILESTAISLTAYLLCELSKWKIDVIFCDEKRMPYSRLSAFAGSFDSSLKFRRQTEWTDESKGAIWAEIIRHKIFSQLLLIPEECSEKIVLLESYLRQIEPGDATNREGHAAKVYFNAVFGDGFSRRKESAINSALNYGYGIMLSAIAREIIANGYCTQLGIFHDNMYNEFNLASDLIEGFRIFVDRMVLEMNPTKLDHEEKVQLVNILNRRVSIDGGLQYMLQAIRIYTKSVLDAIDSGKPEIIKFPNYELPLYETDNIL